MDNPFVIVFCVIVPIVAMLAIMWSSSRNAANAEQARIKARDAYQSFLMEIKTVCTRCGSVLFYGDTLNSGHNEDTVRGDVRC